MAFAPGATTVSSKMPYVWAGLILILMAGLFIISLLFMRPDLDPLLLITSVLGIVSTMFTGIAAYLKSEQTHAVVNSQLSAWKEEFFRMAKLEGIVAGTKDEQNRVAEQLRTTPAPLIAPIPPFILAPVINPVVNPAPAAAPTVTPEAIAASLLDNPNKIAIEVDNVNDANSQSKKAK